MNTIFPTSKTADICLLLEGTFPFVRGGVSSWVYNLITSFPQYKFAAIFLGGDKKDYGEVLYQLPENLVHLEAHYLFQSSDDVSPEDFLEKKWPAMTDEDLEFVRRMHKSFNTMNTEVFSSLKNIHEDQFLHDEKSWEYIKEMYEKKCPGNSFIEYFWTIKNMHKPLWQLLKIIENMPTVKVIHSISTGYAGFLGAMINFNKKLPYVLTEHGIYTKERRIDLMQNYWIKVNFDKNDLNENKEYILNLWIKFFQSLAKMAYTAAEIIISLFSDYQNRQINDGAPKEKTRIIPNGVDVHRFNDFTKKEVNESKPVIALIGRVVPIKDIKTFIRTVPILLKVFPNLEAWIVGPTDENKEYVTECQNSLEALKLEKNITFMGEQDVAKIFPKIDLLVLSSISEGLPLTILESFAAGIPVVATDVGACSQLIYGYGEADKKNGAAGRVVDIANPEKLADAIIELLQNKTKWKMAQNAALKRVEEFYNIDNFIKEYSEIYQGALKNGRDRI